MNFKLLILFAYLGLAAALQLEETKEKSLKNEKEMEVELELEDGGEERDGRVIGLLKDIKDNIKYGLSYPYVPPPGYYNRHVYPPYGYYPRYNPYPYGPSPYGYHHLYKRSADAGTVAEADQLEEQPREGKRLSKGSKEGNDGQRGFEGGYLDRYGLHHGLTISNSREQYVLPSGNIYYRRYWPYKAYGFGHALFKRSTGEDEEEQPREGKAISFEDEDPVYGIFVSDAYRGYPTEDSTTSTRDIQRPLNAYGSALTYPSESNYNNRYFSPRFGYYQRGHHDQ